MARSVPCLALGCAESAERRHVRTEANDVAEKALVCSIPSFGFAPRTILAGCIHPMRADAISNDTI